MPFPDRINLVTLSVADLERARAFYGALGWAPAGPEGDGAQEVAFYDLNGVVLALYLRSHLQRDLGIEADPAPERPDTTLAVNVDSPEAVTALLDEAVRAGARLVAPGATQTWGGFSGLFADPDGHAWEVAYNPVMPLDAAGRMQVGGAGA